MLSSKSPTKKRAREICERFKAANPNPHCELYYQTPYQLLVSVVLSAQATDRSVNKCMQPLYDQGLDGKTVLRWGRETFLEKIRSIGLAPTKAKNVLALTKILEEEHGGKIPRTREALEALPGVGRKTASVILAELYGEPTLAVDTHVFRVAARLGLHQQTDRDKAEQEILRVIDKSYLPAAHHWLILHGRYTCLARKPACDRCIIADLCPSANALR